jgi:prephenate dehydratase
MALNITIQGYEGSFHQVAAQQFFGKQINVVPCDTFRQVIIEVRDGKVDAGMMAIENSIAGSILPNYNLLQQSELFITGEVYLPVKQNLMVNPGVTLADIKEVHSHPMAIQQCLDYLLQHNWKLVETEDTALSARRIHQHKNKHAAAIASSLAAELYHMHIIASDVHTEHYNYTRFLSLQKKPIVLADANKASISFQTDHSKGSLARVLSVIADGGINLSKLQSFPIPGSNWNYMFHADMEFDERQQFEMVVSHIKKETKAVKIFGVYKNGNLS